MANKIPSFKRDGVTVKTLSPAQRQTATHRGYGYAWQKARIGYLQHNPLCAECSKKGRVTAATVVDHITPHKGDQQLFWERSNWQPLCKPCHSRKTAAQDGGFGNPDRKPHENGR